jgi:hypothetical protein
VTPPPAYANGLRRAAEAANSGAYSVAIADRDPLGIR